ncbi:hypothetical protein CERSUDRAFT_117747 [Gelatoporia subvermispora B]|uniref:F-box domain-containing protein n=1 Tax=Ceriporiopsis subvermispora (strain B) TaxID=914234 RepID=M2R3Y2_CERS8|nr:hypothetical protein CERSUDRAFT_117747 [Gelatoporia subvermispora B]
MLTNIAPEVLSAFKGVWRIYLSGRCSQPACIDAILTRFTELRYAHVDNVSCAGQVCPPPQFMAQPAGLRLGASFRWDFNPHWRSLTVLALDAVHLGVLKHAGAFVQAVGPQLVTFSLECVWDSYAVGLWRQIGRINVRHMPKLENLHLRIPESAPYKHGWAYRVLGQHDDNVPMGPIPASLREITISLHLTNSRHLADVCRDWSGTHEYWSAPQITIKFIHVAGLPFDDAEQAIRASFGRLYFPRQLEVINPSP